MLSLSRPRLNLPQSARTLAIHSVSRLAASNSPIPHPTFINASESNQPQSCSCDKHLTEIIIDLRAISDQPPINALDGLITDHLYLVERRLVMLLSRSSPNTNRHSAECQAINGPCFLAALTYLYISLRDFPIQAPLFSAFTTRLDDALLDSTENGGLKWMWSESSYPMLVWVLAVGALVANGRAKRGRFVRELERVAWVLGVGEFEQFVAALGKIVWSGRSEDGGVALLGLWGEVLEIRRGRREVVGIGGEIISQGPYGGLMGEGGRLPGLF
jgi:hypothetical protein